MADKVISVIVPVYKVEPYIRKCLDSIIDQTYEELEIILVDDGSPDRCGAICDEYSKKDKRIRVIHKTNGGLSSARNAGLREAAGDYIGWVDSDDWVEKDMFETLFQAAEKYGANIAVCGHWEESAGARRGVGCDELQVLNTGQAMGMLLHGECLQACVWDKLFQRELFDDIAFPERHNFEDLAVMHRLFARAERVVCIPDRKYNYLLRGDSIINDMSLRNRMDYYAAAKKRREELIGGWPQYETALDMQELYAAISIWCCYYSNPKEERGAYLDQIREIAGICGERYKKAEAMAGFGVAGRAVARLLPYPAWWSLAAAGIIGALYRRKHRRPF